MTTPENVLQTKFDESYAQRLPDLAKTLRIAFIGKVGSGKSSLINAFLRRGRENAVAAVGALSGVTKELKVFRLDEHVYLVDSPGLADVAKENSEVTRAFLDDIDVGLFVVTGSADATQKADFDMLRSKCKKAFVVLNKVDEWDDLETSELQRVVDQWRSSLDVDAVYPTCTKGFDPKTRAGRPLDTRGVDELRTAVESFVETEGKALLLARQMGEKRSYALKIIVAALVAAGGEAFLPGSAVFITATQATAITALYYLYTGRILSKASALALIPTFAAESIGTSLFLWAKSVLPPTLVLDTAAAGVAVLVTAAMLLSVNSVLASGAELHEKEALRTKYRQLHGQLRTTVSGAGVSEWTSLTFWQSLIRDIMYA